MEKVLITGASGFIGSHVVEYFLEKGVSVGCLIRKSSNTENIKELNVELEYGDTLDRVIHIAGLATDWEKWKKFYEVNVTGTMNVLKACKEVNINDIIITASISVYGEENGYVVKNEDSPLNSHYNYFLDKVFPSGMNYYRDSKAVAKREAIKYSQENGLNLTIIEPAWVYGEREFNTGFYEYIKTVKEGIPYLPGSKRNKFHVVYVKDLARAYYLVYKKSLKGINAIIIGNEKVETMDNIYSLFCKKLELKKPKKLPKLIVYPIGLMLELIYTIFKIRQSPILTRARVNMLYDSIEYSTKKAEKLLDFTAEYTLEDGISRTVEWYKKQKLL